MSRTLAHDRRGVVSIEFLIAFLPLLVLFLGVIQLALLGAARLIVRHAAVAGARSAAVVLDDDPARYGGVGRGELGGSDDGSDSAALFALAGAIGADASAQAPASATFGPRYAAIRRAVYMPLTAIAAEPQQFIGLTLGARSTVADTLSSAPLLRVASGLFATLPITTAVTFPVARGASELFEDAVESDQEVTVRVTQLVPCTVPLARILICRTLGYSVQQRRPLLLGGAAEPADGAALDELARAPASGLQALLALGHARVVVLQGEATMPRFTAPFPYPSERDAPPAP